MSTAAQLTAAHERIAALEAALRDATRAMSRSGLYFA
jgi:hypothetical protein